MMKVQMALLVLALSMVASSVEARGPRMMRQQGYTTYYSVPNNTTYTALNNATSVPTAVVSPSNVVVQGTTSVQAPTTVGSSVVQTSGTQATGGVISQAGAVMPATTMPASTGVAAHGSAQWKAEQSARLGSVQHLGGGFGGGSFEGNGFGATADQAIRNSCFWGQRTPIEIGVARGANGYYATIFYR